jgi:cytochrome c oxidase assembly protein subunit 11
MRAQESSTATSPANRKNRSLAIKLLLLTLVMFGFSFALVPFYDVLCKVTGLNGKTALNATAAGVESPIIDTSRVVTVQFLATTNKQLPWQFYPMVKSISLHPGERKRIAYFAKNISPDTMTVQAIPSVTPGLAAGYLKKTECFCFTQQTFKSGEAREMPVIFHLDAELPKEINTISLSYTLFDASKFVKKQPQAAGRLS